jgi:hypothetical protein
MPEFLTSFSADIFRYCIGKLVIVWIVQLIMERGKIERKRRNEEIFIFGGKKLISVN